MKVAAYRITTADGIVYTLDPAPNGQVVSVDIPEPLRVALSGAGESLIYLPDSPFGLHLGTALALGYARLESTLTPFESEESAEPVRQAA
jgi:hypothetical protein